MVAWVRQELKGRLLAARELRDRKARTLLKVGSAALAACKPPNAAAATVAPAACTALRRQKSGGAAVGDVGNSSATLLNCRARLVNCVRRTTFELNSEMQALDKERTY